LIPYAADGPAEAAPAGGAEPASAGRTRVFGGL